MPPLLAAITAIGDSAGTQIDLVGVEELRIVGPGLTVARVTGDGPARVEIRTSGGASFAGLYSQLGTANPTTDVNNVIVCAPSYAASLLATVSAIADGSLTADGTDYRTVRLLDVAPDGSYVQVYATDTRPSPTGTGDWTTPARIVATWAPVGGYELAAGHCLVAGWGSAGAGVAFPGCTWRID